MNGREGSGTAGMDDAFRWMVTKTFLCLHLAELVEDERRGLAEYDSLMIELKELSTYSLTHADIVYSAKGLRLLTLAAFFGLPFADGSLDFSRHAWRRGKLSRRALDYRATGDVSR